MTRPKGSWQSVRRNDDCGIGVYNVDRENIPRAEDRS